MLVFVLNSRNNSLGTSFHMFSKAVIVRAFKEAHQRLDLSVQIDPFRRGLAMNEVSLMLFSYCIQRPVYSLKPISCLFNNQDQLNKIISKFMKKYSLIDNQRIRKHLANNSPAKITHAFPKSKRFSNPNPECKEAFYNSAQSTLSKRHSGIGFGKRSDFTKNTIVSPGSPTYKQTSSFQKLGKTYSFSIGREKTQDRHYTYHALKQKTPGPGTYKNQRSSLSNISYTHRPRTIDLSRSKLSFFEVPGPGKYQSLQMTPSNGKFRVSKYSNSRLSLITQDKRFKEEKEKSPGPLAYSTLDDLNKESKYILSNRRGQGTRPFDRERKFTYKYWRYDKNPAPGTYDKPSDFGVYGDYNYYKTLSIIS